MIPWSTGQLVGQLIDRTTLKKRQFYFTCCKWRRKWLSRLAVDLWLGWVWDLVLFLSNLFFFLVLFLKWSDLRVQSLMAFTNRYFLMDFKILLHSIQNFFPLCSTVIVARLVRALVYKLKVLGSNLKKVLFSPRYIF